MTSESAPRTRVEKPPAAGEAHPELDRAALVGGGPTPLERARPSPVAARPIASALRTAAFRSALLFVLFTVALLAFILVVVATEGGSGGRWPPPDFWAALVLCTFTLALVGAPLAFVETFFARRPRSARGDGLAGLLIWLFSVLGFFVAMLQVIYTFTVLESGSIARAADQVTSFLGKVANDPSMLALFFLPAAPFAPAIVARIRQASLGRCVGITIGVGAILALPTLPAVLPHLHSQDMPLILGAALIELVGCALVPVVLHAGDAIERRIGRWLASRDARRL